MRALACSTLTITITITITITLTLANPYTWNIHQDLVDGCSVLNGKNLYLKRNGRFVHTSSRCFDLTIFSGVVLLLCTYLHVYADVGRRTCAIATVAISTRAYAKVD